MSWTSISRAHAYWRRHRAQADPPSDLELAESFILKTRPTNLEDAACILDVVCSYNGDGRCDGLDHAALNQVRVFLITLAQPAAVG